MKKYLTTILLCLTLPLTEVHNYWAGTDENQNWIIAVPTFMPVRWNIRFAADQLIVIIYFLAWLLYYANKVNKTTVLAFFWLAVFDTFLYFWNYKTQGYGSIYLWFAGFWLLCYYGWIWYDQINTWALKIWRRL